MPVKGKRTKYEPLTGRVLRIKVLLSLLSVRCRHDAPGQAEKGGRADNARSRSGLRRARKFDRMERQEGAACSRRAGARPRKARGGPIARARQRGFASPWRPPGAPFSLLGKGKGDERRIPRLQRTGAMALAFAPPAKADGVRSIALPFAGSHV